MYNLVIPQKSARRREPGLLDEGEPQILRWAQDDSQGVCYPEPSEGSATLKMTARGLVILSVAKDLQRTYGDHQDLGDEYPTPFQSVVLERRSALFPLTAECV